MNPSVLIGGGGAGHLTFYKKNIVQNSCIGVSMEFPNGIYSYLRKRLSRSIVGTRPEGTLVTIIRSEVCYCMAVAL